MASGAVTSKTSQTNNCPFTLVKTLMLRFFQRICIILCFDTQNKCKFLVGTSKLNTACQSSLSVKCPYKNTLRRLTTPKKTWKPKMLCIVCFYMVDRAGLEPASINYTSQKHVFELSPELVTVNTCCAGLAGQSLSERKVCRLCALPR